MLDQIKTIGKSIKDFWIKLSSKSRKLIIAGFIGIVIVAIIITLLLNNKDYVILFSNIDEEETVEVLQQLQENKIDYKYENDGTILIPKMQENTLRMQLAQSGHPRTGTNYDVFTQNIDFMTTDYEKRKYEIYQLQERLQDSIKTISGVEEAIVTINIPEEKSFAWETDKAESSASVKVNLLDGKALTTSQTNGIMQLVVKSIEGLTEENVAIVDTDGNSL
ncbi:MAG: flagellar basal-body MS-ring/collar protein FliF, partial [Sedimentibacter sp.]